MKAYSGKDPFVFVSYAHADREQVELAIASLKRKMCRVWYDEGLTPGESWNDDLARHIKECSCFLVFLSASSMASSYVKSEINYAISKGRAVVPVRIDTSEIPEGLEFALGTVQFLNVAGEGDAWKWGKLIAPHLPGGVFAPLLKPYLSVGGCDFFMERADVVSPNYPDRVSNDLRLTVRRCGGDEEELFRFAPGFGYDADYVVTQCSEISDDYYVGRIQGSYLVHILGKFELDYPLTGPDFDVLFIFVLRTNGGEVPTMRFVDYQVVNMVQPTLYEGRSLADTAWGGNVKARLDKALA